MNEKSSIDVILKDPAENEVQAFASRTVQVSHVLEWMLRHAGDDCVVRHTTFSISEEFLRFIKKMRAKHNIKRYELVVDRKALMKVLRLKDFILSATERTWTADNHSKVIVVMGSEMSLLAITSQNLTRGNRCEATMVTSNSEAIASINRSLDKLMESASELNVTHMLQGGG